ncbi:unnamed protein product [Toxocara canis]|uniref:RT_RNaseH_2 domain-containing protein n=1 Tax=Toxocara canis TaxID=6265 RepID=A0A183TVI7_TOXCA|nr:unnamed protein product [Toxocara canis]
MYTMMEKKDYIGRYMSGQCPLSKQCSFGVPSATAWDSLQTTEPELVTISELLAVEPPLFSSYLCGCDRSDSFMISLVGDGVIKTRIATVPIFLLEKKVGALCNESRLQIWKE